VVSLDKTVAEQPERQAMVSVVNGVPLGLLWVRPAPECLSAPASSRAIG
jgi:hypothetical protein